LGIAGGRHYARGESSRGALFLVGLSLLGAYAATTSRQKADYR
jgi:hypothetical protein